MQRYRAEVYYMDTDDLATVLGHFQSQLEARRQSYRHAGRELHFQLYVSGVWKAQGTDHWYQIRQVNFTGSASPPETNQLP